MINRIKVFVCLFLYLLVSSMPAGASNTSLVMSDWFRDFKQQAAPAQLYDFLHAMPKGGDIHHHLSGSGMGNWWWDIATNLNKNGGYTYYTKTDLSLCRGYGTNEFGTNPQLLLFHTVSTLSYEKLSTCEQDNYTALSELNQKQKQAFLNSIKLDKPHEGRDEFFQAHWQRMGDMLQNPYIYGHLLLKNMQAYQRENVLYLETQLQISQMRYPDGTPYTSDEVVQILSDTLKSDAAKKTNVTVRFQLALVRFLPDAEQQLEKTWATVNAHRELFVGINLVGREDNDKGYPLRFLPTLRKLRAKSEAIPLSIHAGESDEPNTHIKDTLLLGADRIGHGFNLIEDPDTLLMMRNGPYLIEINLISNLLLEYTNSLDSHPFPEYLRTGVPVTLSTDDRGMWSSNLTDEYYLAVKHFNLSWEELVALNSNAIKHSFIGEEKRQALLLKLEQQTEDFINERLNNTPLPNIENHFPFICSYDPQVCNKTSKR
ncbi:adenosine deaminase family protein [Alteromonas sp. RW2A1]|uniref:adenosine deaminase family protein n=1 Tax=Alteromonas sp. RW2A1 TaxID=1917158 RepID=UPI0009042B04|nr:adenosine deaminase [Alteromonas sp. RW2A1]